MPVFSSLPMYTEPACIREASEAFIDAVFERLGIAGQQLPPDDLYAQWTDPDLLFSQSCGYPVMTRLQERVQVVATPCYALPGCQGNQHSSFIVVRADDVRATLADFRGSKIVLNALDSNSGMNLLRQEVAPLAERGRFFGEVKVSEAHVNSLVLISQGDAELSAIDAVTWGYLERYAPERLKDVRCLQQTALTPALPIITALHRSAEECEQVLAALNAVLQERPQLAETLAITGFVPASLEDYHSILQAKHNAVAAGYPIVA
ncbi:ABC-type phosphate/phosphonate transport system substrate-binding protein [Pseudomonas duriflava]|uniref:ABC-type phosphate/phosphonate transport system substrate-binding protein n=1 Tax=Pseudomonas duriflava TaxID=459528 RepID=A0A562QFW1_9PSED|nr:PhnD/SsuA/transferrin family substrate-binding protein [Pseudomonas duriflava]TWI55609.1 ABC-type phosphate/phosphonate transport system substrate-binding protein [Pseudomonas duriflava]